MEVCGGLFSIGHMLRVGIPAPHFSRFIVNSICRCSELHLIGRVSLKSKALGLH